MKKNRKTLGADDASVVALSALAYLAGDPRLFSGFLDATGSTVEDLKARADTRETQASVLAYFLQDEPLLLAFCATAGFNEGEVAEARRALSRPGAP